MSTNLYIYHRINTVRYNNPDDVGGFIDVIILVKLHGSAEEQTDVNFNLSVFVMFHWCAADHFSQ